MTAYVQDKVVEALKASKGVRASAKRRLAALCATDQQFLLDVVAPHLSAILDHAVQHYARAELTKMSKPAALKSIKAPKAEVPSGEAMLRRFASQNTPVFGMDDAEQGTGKRPAASARHLAAIDKIAKRVDKNPQ